ncbi:MAG TPA: PKD domain-containing protein, partial [Anaerolineae bacterium]|nr:PKD domain-containing protein [Anaerolineae bacterium]
MSAPGRVIRRPQSTLITYGSPPTAVYKLSQRDVPRVEQAADTALDFLSQPALQAAVESLGVPLLALDAEDQAALAPLGYVPPAAPGPTPPGQAARPAGAPPVPPSSPGRPDAAAPADESPAPGLRMGLVAAVIVLAAVVLVILLLLSRLFTGPDTSADATGTPGATTTLTATLTLTPSAPTAVALSNVSVRSGPGEDYPVIGILPAGGSAAIIGRTDAGDWWQLQGANIQGGQGWAPADRVQAQNAGAVPVVPPPPLPTPTPTPLTTFSGWKGEYFANPNLQAPPAVVQDDPTINFNWGSGAPAPGVPADNFSVRWSRQAPFDEGNYRFQVTVQGGVRLWLDGRPLIDDWQSGPLRRLEADSGLLSRGDHSLVVEYFKQTGPGQIAVSWQLMQVQPPTAIISGPSQGVTGQPLLFNARNATAAPGRQIVRCEWRFGDGSGAEGVEVTKTYGAAGSFDVTLVVTDDAGLTGVAVQQVAIVAPTATPTPIVPPVAIISGPSQVVAGVAVTFDGSSSTPVGGLASYQWNFGDGGGATGATVNHAFAQAGVFNVTLVVTNTTGQTSQAGLTVQVSPTQPPTPTPLPLEGTLWTLQGTQAGTAL